MPPVSIFKAAIARLGRPLAETVALAFSTSDRRVTWSPRTARAPIEPRPPLANPGPAYIATMANSNARHPMRSVYRSTLRHRVRQQAVEPLSEDRMAHPRDVLDSRSKVIAAQSARLLAQSASRMPRRARPRLALLVGLSCIVLGASPAGHAMPGSMPAQMDHVPEFADESNAAGPVVDSLVDGPWSNPETWSLQRVPQSGDVVRVHHEVSFDMPAVDIHTLAVYPGGHLELPVDDDVTLRLVHLLVTSGGTLTIGTDARPVWGNVEITFKDVPLDPQIDPMQFGNGLVVLGALRIHGRNVERTWLRVSEEPRAGHSTITLDGIPTGWTVGSRIVIPDSRQVMPHSVYAYTRGQGNSSFGQQWEERTITAISGNVIELDRSLDHDHLGARHADGALSELLPHVALLSRNITFRSENPSGVRGHFIAMRRADVDVRFAAFVDMGRTRSDVVIDNTVFELDGSVKHVGTNQIARYPIHAHHLIGPVNPNNAGYQFVLIGNAVDGAPKWGVTIHASSYGLIENNVTYNVRGAGFVTEDGTERENDFVDNIAIRNIGTGRDGNVGQLRFASGDYGRGGVGFWFRTALNNVRGNVAANSLYGGYVITNYYPSGDDKFVPTFRGADVSASANRQSKADVSVGDFSDNEAYGLTNQGLWMAHPGFASDWQDFVLSRLKLWHIHSRYLTMYHVAHITIEDLVAIGDRNAFLDGGDGARTPSARKYPPVGFKLDGPYGALALRVERASMENLLSAFLPTKKDGSHRNPAWATHVVDSYFHNYTNFKVTFSENSSGGTPSRHVVLRNNILKVLDDVPPYPGREHEQRSIVMSYQGSGRVSPMVESVLEVFQHNGDASDNFRIYYEESHPNFVVPLSATRFPASPEEGLTNLETWTRYRIAIGGALAPCETRDQEIIGFVCPISPWSDLPAPDDPPYRDPGPVQPYELVIGDTDRAVDKTGTWSVSSGRQPHGATSVYSDAGSTFRWLPELSERGTYAIYAWWTYHRNRSRSVPYRVRHDGGTATVTVDQRDPSLAGRWNLLGTFTLGGGGREYVEISSENGQACADAVRFTPLLLSPSPER